MSNDIKDRLLCRYASGPMMPNGEPEFGWRDMSGEIAPGIFLPSNIMKEAAAYIGQNEEEIKRLHKENANLSEEVENLNDDMDSLEEEVRTLKAQINSLTAALAQSTNIKS